MLVNLNKAKVTVKCKHFEIDSTVKNADSDFVVVVFFNKGLELATVFVDY